MLIGPRICILPCLSDTLRLGSRLQGQRRLASNGSMGGACPSRAPPTPSVEGSRAPPPPLVGGWYRDGKNWVRAEVNVVITGDMHGNGTMPAADVVVMHFEHNPHRGVRGDIQPNGDIKWANGKAWLKYEGEWQDHGGSASGSAPHLPISPGSASESMSPKLVNESLIVAAPAELAPQEPQANLAARPSFQALPASRCRQVLPASRSSSLPPRSWHHQGHMPGLAHVVARRGPHVAAPGMMTS